MLCVGVLALVSAQADAQIPQNQSNPPQVVISASADVHLQPDRATIWFSVETRAQTAGVAAAENAKRQKAVMDALRSKIGQQDQISTTSYSVSTDDRYDSGQRKVVGYVARNTVLVETRAPERVGAFIDVALANGSNLVSGLRFWSSATDGARRDALTLAVNKARSDADAMARAAGGSLGALLELSSQGTSLPTAVEGMVAMRAAAPETPISPTELTVTATVSARWTFVPGK
jgi:uncharacterized protein YggE